MSSDTLTKYKQLLAEFLSFRTVSTIESGDETEKAVNWLESLFRRSGFDTRVIKGFDNPVLISSKIFDPSLPTVLIYGHYDVQPASFDEWGSDPFTLREENGRLYGRGVADNKGQMLVHLVSAIELIEENRLAYNVKFLIEGNEETGSPNIKKLIEEYRSELENDFILISDSSLLQGHPTVELSMRGTFNTALTIKTSDRDLHSGLFGGAVPNAARVAAEFLSNLYSQNKISYPEFYKRVEAVDEVLKKAASSIPLDEENFRRLTGTKSMLLEDGESYFSQVGLRPTIQVTGFESGYTGMGYRNSIPSSTTLKFNFRLVLHQDPKEVLEDFKAYAKQTLPEYVDHEFAVPESTEGFVEPIKLSSDSKYHKHVENLLKEVYEKDVYYDFNGATLPIVADFKTILQSDILMVALANEDCNMHAVDENFDLQTVRKALEFSDKFLSIKL